MSEPTSRHWALLAGSAVLLGAACACLGQNVGGFEAWVWLAMATGVVGGALVIGTAVSWARVRVGSGWMLAVFATGVLFRLLLWPSDWYLSDDAYRYHWDGKAIVHGVNPYEHAPEDPAVDPLRVDAIDERINHPSYHTVYPPLAQAFFAAGYLLTPGSLTGFRLLLLLSEIVAWWLLLRELRRRELAPAWILVLAWSPLVIIESYLPAHLDALALPWLVLFISSLGRRRPLVAGAALAMTCLVKPWVILFAPAAVRETGIRSGLLAGAVFVGVVGIAYLPFASAGWYLFDSMWLMAKFWKFNGSLAVLVDSLLPGMAARWVLGALLLAMVSLAAWRGRDFLQRLLLAVAAFVVCSTTLFPWYLVWMLPLLVLRPDPALLALGVLIPISEVVIVAFRLNGDWNLPLWASLAQYLPFYFLLALSAWRRWGMFRRADSG